MDGFAAVRRWWWVLLLGAVVAGVVAYGLVSTVERKYTAETRLLVGPISADKDTLEAAGQLARTYAEIATSEPLVAEVARRVGRDEPVEDVVEDMSTASNDVNRIVTVGVTDTDAGRASRLANAVGRRLREISRESAAPDEAALDALAGEPEILRLPRPARARIQRAAARVFAQSRAGRIQVVEPASKPGSPSSPRVSLLVALAALAGLIATALLIFLRAAAAESAGDSHGLAEVEEAPFLGTVDTGGRRAGELRVGQGYGYRLLAGRAGLLSSAPLGTSLLVLDVGEGRAAATVALNLAAALEYDGRPALLIDASLDDAMVASPDEGDERLGYRDLLSKTSPDRSRIDALTVERPDGLKVVPLGDSAKRFIDLEHVRGILEAASSDGTVVIVGGASIHRSAATLSWSRAVESNLLVVDARYESRDRLAELAQTLVGLGAKITGTVVGRSAAGGWWRRRRPA